MSRQWLVVEVHGIPGPQGSKRHLGHGVLVESSALVKPWREAVRSAAEVALGRRSAERPWAPGRLDPIEVSLVFTLARPASHYRSGRNAHLLRDAAPEQPSTRPDLDKLIRSTLDALRDAGALVDDARVVEVRAVKAYPEGHLDALDTPGAVISLRAAS